MAVQDGKGLELRVWTRSKLRQQQQSPMVRTRRSSLPSNACRQGLIQRSDGDCFTLASQDDLLLGRMGMKRAGRKAAAARA